MLSSHIFVTVLLVCDDTFEITNTHTPEKTKVSGIKTWNDNDNQDGLRPESIVVNLYANGTIVGTQVVDADDNWEYSFIDLPKYSEGNVIQYTIQEVVVEGYSTEINGYDITNSYNFDDLQLIVL